MDARVVVVAISSRLVAAGISTVVRQVAIQVRISAVAGVAAVDLVLAGVAVNGVVVCVAGVAATGYHWELVKARGEDVLITVAVFVVKVFTKGFASVADQAKQVAQANFLTVADQDAAVGQMGVHGIGAVAGVSDEDVVAVGIVHKSSHTSFHGPDRSGLCGCGIQAMSTFVVASHSEVN